jgi:flagellar FliL protein
MAEQTPAPEAADKTAKKKKNPVVLFGMLGGILIVLTGASYFAVTKMTGPADATPAEAGMGHGGGHEKSGPVFQFELEDLILNSADTNTTRFVKIGLVFEAGDEKVVHELEEREYRVRDLLISLIGRRTAAELSTAEARDVMRTQILDELNASFDGGIRDVYFTDFIIQ